MNTQSDEILFTRPFRFIILETTQMIAIINLCPNRGSQWHLLGLVSRSQLLPYEKFSGDLHRVCRLNCINTHCSPKFSNILCRCLKARF
jgi:hypothetical protein